MTIITKPPYPLRFISGIMLTLIAALGIIYLIMTPTAGEISLMALFLSITAAISVLAGYGAYRLGWINHSPHISWVLLGGYALSSLLTFLNVWVTARLMFASRHDLVLATVLLLFAGGIAMSVGYFLSVSLTDRLVVLDQAAKAIAGGRLDVKVPVIGRNEIDSLAQTFNEMSRQLQETADKQKELETLRRNLIAWVGHDLRTPLASIRAIVEALADGVVEDPATVERYLQTAQGQIRSLSSLIDDLFELAQLEAGGLRLDAGLNSIADLISDSLESFSVPAARQNVTLTGMVEPGIDLICMDTQKIGRVLTNLMGNALRHTPAGGTVSVHAVTEAGKVRVEVCDTGSGISAEDMPYIFERFYRGEKSRSRATGGAGLGLAIAKGIIEAHGGAIGVENTGQGARFYFLLALPE